MCDYIELNHHLRRLDVTVGKAFDEAALSRFEKVVLASSRSVRKLNLQNVPIHETIDIFVNNDLTSKKYPRDFRYVSMQSPFDLLDVFVDSDAAGDNLLLTHAFVAPALLRHQRVLKSVTAHNRTLLDQATHLESACTVGIGNPEFSGQCQTRSASDARSLRSKNCYHQRRRAMEERCEK